MRNTYLLFVYDFSNWERLLFDFWKDGIAYLNAYTYTRKRCISPALMFASFFYPPPNNNYITQDVIYTYLIFED